MTDTMDQPIETAEAIEFAESINGIEYAAVDPQGNSVAYLQEPSSLTLTLRNVSGRDIPLTGGRPVPQGDAAQGQTTLIYLFFSTLVENPGTVTVSAPGWTTAKHEKPNTPAVWALAPDADGKLAAGQPLSISLGNIRAVGLPRPLSFRVEARRLPPTMPAWSRAIPIMAVTRPPAGPQRLPVEFTVNQENPTVYISDGETIPNHLVFRLTNTSREPITVGNRDWEAKPPKFTLTFFYAEPDDDGHGALTTVQHADRFRSVTVQAYGNRMNANWVRGRTPYCEILPQRDSSAANTRILGTGGAAHFEFMIHNIVTALPEGTTQAFLTWTNFHGYGDDFASVTLRKRYPRSDILRFHSLTPTEIKPGEPVRLAWQTSALKRVVLSWIDDNKVRELSTDRQEIRFNEHDFSIGALGPQDGPVQFTLRGYLNNNSEVQLRQLLVRVQVDPPKITSLTLRPPAFAFDAQHREATVVVSWTAENARWAEIVSGAIPASTDVKSAEADLRAMVTSPHSMRYQMSSGYTLRVHGWGGRIPTEKAVVLNSLSNHLGGQRSWQHVFNSESRQMVNILDFRSAEGTWKFSSKTPRTRLSATYMISVSYSGTTVFVTCSRFDDIGHYKAEAEFDCASGVPILVKRSGSLPAMVNTASEGVGLPIYEEEIVPFLDGVNPGDSFSRQQG